MLAYERVRPAVHAWPGWRCCLQQRAQSRGAPRVSRLPRQFRPRVQPRPSWVQMRRPRTIRQQRPRPTTTRAGGVPSMACLSRSAASAMPAWPRGFKARETGALNTTGPAASASSVTQSTRPALQLATRPATARRPRLGANDLPALPPAGHAAVTNSLRRARAAQCEHLDERLRVGHASTAHAFLP